MQQGLGVAQAQPPPRGSRTPSLLSFGLQDGGQTPRPFLKVASVLTPFQLGLSLLSTPPPHTLLIDTNDGSDSI